MNGKLFRCQADTGATCNVLSYEHLKKLVVNLNKLKIKRENKTNLVVYNGTKITTVGSIYLKIFKKRKKIFYFIFDCLEKYISNFRML